MNNQINLDVLTDLLDKILPFLKDHVAPKWRQLIAWTIAAVVITALNLYLGANYPVPEPPVFTSPIVTTAPPDEVVALGVSHQRSALELSGSETDQFVVNQTSTGDIVEFRDNGTVVWRLADGGTITHNGSTNIAGNCLDLDADADTSLCSDTDDQIDYELGGADIFVMKEWGASTITTDTTEHLFEIQDATPVMTGGTNSLAALNIDLGIGNSTAGTNNIAAILVDDISQDAQNTETVLDIAGTGWDVGISLGGNQFDLDADDDTSITADTDDQIDIEIAGADDFQFTANTFTAQSGSSIVLDSGAYPLGYASSGQQLVFGTTAVTATATANHGLTTVTFCMCTLGVDADTDAGDPVVCTTSVSGNVCTLKLWQDDWSAAATASQDVHWFVVGTP